MSGRNTRVAQNPVNVTRDTRVLSPQFIFAKFGELTVTRERKREMNGKEEREREIVILSVSDLPTPQFSRDSNYRVISY